MRRFATLWPYLFLLCGCVAGPSQVNVPDEAIGTISGPVYTGWNQDLCNEGQVTTSLPGCAPLGPGVYQMEIHRVTLRDLRTLDGQEISPQLVVGLMSHALPKDYRERQRISLKQAPENFRVATGIEYLAWALE